MSSQSSSLQDLVARNFGDANQQQLRVLVLLLAALVTLPLWLVTIPSLLGLGSIGGSFVYAFALANVWAIFAMGWDIISGHTGYISFGHSALSGSAAYTTALLTYNIDPSMSMAVTIPLSVIAAVVIGFLFALPSLRLHGPYFSLLTLVAALILYRLVYVFNEYTGGELGIGTVPVVTYDTVSLYYLTLIPMLVIAFGLLYVSRSNVGAVFVAIRENEPAVEAAGIDTTKFKLWAFTLSAVPMGVGGTILAHFYGNVDPNTFLLVDRSIEMIAIAAIGGMSSILGPVGGAYLFLTLKELVLPEFLGPTARWFALWFLVLVIIVYARDGLFRKLWHSLGDIGGDADE